MTKLFYTDALKAEWMFREFNVRLDPVAGQNIYYNEEHVLFCVSPSSLHIFEPMEGDVVLSPSGAPWLSTGRKAIAAIHGNEIIQRNGKAFFMPEVES